MMSKKVFPKLFLCTILTLMLSVLMASTVNAWQSPFKLISNVFTKSATKAACKKAAQNIAKECAENVSAQIARTAVKQTDDLARSACSSLAVKASSQADEGIKVLKTMAQSNSDDIAKAMHKLQKSGIKILPQNLNQIAGKAAQLQTVLGKSCVTEAVELTAKYGDDAINICTKLGQRGVYYLNKHGPSVTTWYKEASKLNMAEEFLEALIRYGDRFIKHLDEHKLLYGGGITLAAFLKNPEPVLGAVSQTAVGIGEKTVVPIVKTTIESGADTVKNSFSLLINSMGPYILLLVFVLTLPWYLPKMAQCILNIVASIYLFRNSSQKPASSAEISSRYHNNQ